MFWTIILSMLMRREGRGKDKPQDIALCVGCKYGCYTDCAVRLDILHGLEFTIQNGSKCCRVQQFTVCATFKILVARRQTWAQNATLVLHNSYLLWIICFFPGNSLFSFLLSQIEVSSLFKAETWMEKSERPRACRLWFGVSPCQKRFWEIPGCLFNIKKCGWWTEMVNSDVN